MKKSLLLAAVVVAVAACADMTPTRQRALTGTAAGVGVGAIAGAMVGTRGSEPLPGQAPACSAGFSSISRGRPRTEPFSRASRPDNRVAERLAAETARHPLSVAALIASRTCDGEARFTLSYPIG
jgi:hypothetical protein